MKNYLVTGKIFLIFFICWGITPVHGADDEFTIITNDVGSRIDLTARTTVDSEYSVVITFNSFQNLSPSTTQTLYNVKGKGDTYLMSLNYISLSSGFSYDWKYVWNFGFSGENHNDDYVYRLPYSSDSSYSVGQGYFGSFSHEGTYAIDWTLPIGTPIYAAREGRVLHLKEDSNVAGVTEEYTAMANFVLIGHDDGSQANYAHLQQNGALVEVGDWVSLGQQIGLSGNTGFSTGPHLHFIVNQQKSPDNTTSIPTKFSDKDGNILSLVEDDEYFGSGEFKDPNLAPALRIGTQIDGKTKWRTGSWLGTMFDPAKSWIFHIGLGWVYPIELEDQSVWLYNDNLKWIWTKESVYPWLYFHTDEVWRYYLSEKGFYDEKQKEWIELSP
ncbi:MAG: M23 family metallopeptidase [Opitutae bacterium]|nr:M23 family metallopeptidase [Opitutae bacterium]